MSSFKFCGFNFNEIDKERNQKEIEFKEISTKIKNLRISSGPYYEIYVMDDEFEVVSCLTELKQNKYKLPSRIQQYLISNEVTYFLLENHQIFTYNFNELTQIETADKFNQISCTSSHLYGFTTQKVYQIIPSFKLIFEFPSHQRIKKICSGLEHTLIMTSNGDLFSFGCGLRGQLGHGDVRSHEAPKLIDALAGIKIIDMACGAFHSVVVSSFGDVYTFGWNTDGQLGLKKAPQGTFDDNNQIRCQQVFALPQLIELEDDCSIKNVYCGHKHTLLRSDSDRLFSAGLNNYGQLGLSTNANNVDEFTEIPLKVNEKDIIHCGHFSTLIFNGQK